MGSRPIYLDYNATTPVDPRVAEAMLPFLHTHFGNPSSSHAYGRVTRDAVERARAQVASLLGASPDEIIFTSGGTESNNAVIKGAVTSSGMSAHIITSAVEHPAVLEPCETLRRAGHAITILPVDSNGMVDPADVEAAITPDSVLITIMHANNEVGTIEPIERIAEIAKRHKVPFHSDAAQSVGKVLVNVDALGVDSLSLAGHKLYAPKGVGALYIRAGAHVPKFIHGASHESNRRAGTENVLEIVGLGEAAALAERELSGRAEHMRAMRDRLWAGLSENVDDLRLNGHPDLRLPNTLSVSVKNADASVLLTEIEEFVAVSAGAACHGHGVDISTVLLAMDVPREFAMGTLRFSTGKSTTEDDVDEAVRLVTDAVRRLRVSDA